MIDQDDGIRPGTTPASLGQLRPVFKKGGSTTAGNSSQVRAWPLPPLPSSIHPSSPWHTAAATTTPTSPTTHPPTRPPTHPPSLPLPLPGQVTDGAAAVMLMSRREAARRGLPILGIFRSFAAVGVPPSVMGIGPAVAVPAAVEMAGLALEDIDVYEINEAFASQARGRVGAWACLPGLAGGRALRSRGAGCARGVCGPGPSPPPPNPQHDKLAPATAAARTRTRFFLLPRRCRPPTAWTSWGWMWTRSTPTVAPSRWATRSAAPGPARWAPGAAPAGHGGRAGVGWLAGAAGRGLAWPLSVCLLAAQAAPAACLAEPPSAPCRGCPAPTPDTLPALLAAALPADSHAAL